MSALAREAVFRAKLEAASPGDGFVEFVRERYSMSYETIWNSYFAEAAGE